MSSNAKTHKDMNSFSESTKKEQQYSQKTELGAEEEIGDVEDVISSLKVKLEHAENEVIRRKEFSLYLLYGLHVMKAVIQRHDLLSELATEFEKPTKPYHKEKDIIDIWDNNRKMRKASQNNAKSFVSGTSKKSTDTKSRDSACSSTSLKVKYTAKQMVDIAKPSPKTPEALSLTNYAALSTNGNQKFPSASVGSVALHTSQSKYPNTPSRSKKSPKPASKGHSDADTPAPFFKVWPLAEARNKPHARVRRVILRYIPAGYKASQVISLVYCGRVEQLLYTLGSDYAQVLFVTHQECSNYFDSTANGVEARVKGGGERVNIVDVELSTCVDIMSSLIAQHIDRGATRCVRILGIDTSKVLRIQDLEQLAGGQGRQVESIRLAKSGNGKGLITFRFCSISDAVRFKGNLERHDAWENYNIQFSDDPCAQATEPHFND